MARRAPPLLNEHPARFPCVGCAEPQGVEPGDDLVLHDAAQRLLLAWRI